MLVMEGWKGSQRHNIEGWLCAGSRVVFGSARVGSSFALPDSLVVDLPLAAQALHLMPSRNMSNCQLHNGGNSLISSEMTEYMVLYVVRVETGRRPRYMEYSLRGSLRGYEGRNGHLSPCRVRPFLLLSGQNL